MTDDELKRLFETMRQDNAAIRAETAAIRQDNTAIRAETAAMRQENAAKWQENAAAHAETRRHFEVIAERLEKKIDAVAESVAIVDEKLDRETADIREEMRRGFADTQAMIKFSHAELDRRVRALEQAFADLQARVERLEATTH